MIPDLIECRYSDTQDKIPFTAVYMYLIARLLWCLGETRGAVSVTSVWV